MEKYRSGHNEPHSKCGCPQGHVGSNPTFSANKACNCNGYRLLNFLEIAVFARFSVGRTAEYLGRTSAIFEKYRLYRIENRNYIQQFFHLLSKQLSSGNSSIFVMLLTITGISSIPSDSHAASLRWPEISSYPLQSGRGRANKGV